MNTKAIPFLNRVPIGPLGQLGYLSIAVASLVCCTYVAWISSFFLAHHWFPVSQGTLSEDVLQQIGTIRDRRLGEISGIAMSLKYKNKFWVHNDSGNPAELFLIDSDGSVLASIKLKGAVNRDWEDICTFSANDSTYICVGDVGDNRGRHKDYQLYILKEPKLNLEKPSANADSNNLVVSDFSKIKFSYEDGPKNCEAFSWDPTNNCILLAEKGFDARRKSNLGIYRLTLSESFDQATDAVAKRVANCHLKNVTAMSISGNGKRLILSSYAIASVWKRQEKDHWIETLKSTKPTPMPLPIQRQGEAIALNHEGDVAFTTSEHFSQPLWQIQVDSAIKPQRTKTKSQ